MLWRSSGKVIESNARFIVVRPCTLPDLIIERMCPRTVASLKRTGSIAVAVNLSPTRDSLLDSVSFKRTFKFVPTGTRTGATTRGAGRRRRGLVVCAPAITGSAIRIRIVIERCLMLDFIRLLLLDDWPSEKLGA